MCGRENMGKKEIREAPTQEVDDGRGALFYLSHQP